MTRRDERVALRAREWQILACLLERPGIALTRAHIARSIYGVCTGFESNGMEVHISSLRRKLGPECIRTIRGTGYLMERW
ncbi:winged helix-turn-helix domain-containing protein [Paraburkholderia diazotrophica]|uniref:winged helix-turn-helix domain-containing protein n=1 Tax=Paraburkholderia diazotrophica TaxID=667676 RepID=UPI0038995D99